MIKGCGSAVKSETTAAALSCIFFQLCMHPEVLRKLRDEVDDHYRDHNGVASSGDGGSGGDDDNNDSKRVASRHSDLHKLKYLQACINEAMRLHVGFTPSIPTPHGWRGRGGRG